jgi:hypothetical protein
MLSEEDVMQSSVFELGEQRGEKKGEFKMLARGYERRLRRPLTEAERGTLALRVEKLGMDRMLDVQNELAVDALAAWLADPTAA